MTRVESWSGIRLGTLVTLRRGPLTGDQVERTKAWTAGGPYYSESGVACIPVDVGGAVVAYPLDRVSLGWDEPLPPAVRIATALDPVPTKPPPLLDTFSVALACCALAYVVAMGLVAIAAAVLR